MNSFVALLRREWLEWRPGIFWSTFGLLGFIVVATLLGGIVSSVSDVSVVTVSEQVDDRGNTFRDERSTDSLARLVEFTDMTDRELSRRLNAFRLAAAAPFQAVFFLLLFIILVSSIFDERRDRTVLFWKSMPVNDIATVASKLLLPVWLAPAAVVLAISLAWLFFLIVGTVVTLAGDLGSVARLWQHSGVLMGFVQQVAGFLIQGLWSLPIYGWLLLVSATATRLPLAWALALPFAAGLLERILFRTDVLYGFIIRHVELAALPSIYHGDRRSMPAVDTLGDQLSLLLTGDLWLGLLLGGALLAGAVYFRRRNNEL